MGPAVLEAAEDLSLNISGEINRVMKKIYLTLLISSLCLAAPEKPKDAVPPSPAAPTIPRFQHLQDADGRILMTRDNKEKTIDYKADPKKIVDQLLSDLDNLGAACQKKIQEILEPKKK